MKMDKNKIIEEGWLEHYAIGALDLDDTKMVEGFLNAYPELQKHLNDIELTLEKIGLENTKDVPKHIKESLFNSIREKDQKNPSNVKPFNFSFAISASVAALLLLGCFYFYSELKGVRENVMLVEEKNKALKTDLDKTIEKLDETQSWLTMITNANTDKYLLKGNDLAPEAKLASYVNHKTKSVTLHAMNLPELDEQHDYQMWADVDGKMINMGVIPRNKELIAMTYIENAESLNITIEPAGGNDHPTVERLISNVYLN